MWFFFQFMKIGTHENKAIQSTNENYTKVMKDWGLNYNKFVESIMK